MPTTDDPNDPALHETGPDGQHKKYLVLSEAERNKGYVRPLRRSYRHIGGCQAVTTMGAALCSTYARDPKFYGATYCGGCHRHAPVAQFVWEEDGAVVGS